VPDANIDLGEAMRIAAEDRFWAMRGHAAQSYAGLEQSLCNLFAILSDTAPEVAGIIFFRIASADARNKIIEKLFRRKFGDNFSLFRNSLLTLLRPINQKRNEIVHWSAVSSISGGDESGNYSVRVSLRPPGFAYNLENSEEIDTEDLLQFMAKCSFFTRLLSIFSIIARDQMPEDDKKSWLDIFRQPIVYPPPVGHPLSLKQQAPETPPRSSSE
jgi:hypothetical protein